MDAIRAFADQHGFDRHTVNSLVDFVVRYIEDQCDELEVDQVPQTAEQLEPYVVAGVMEFMSQHKRMVMAMVTHPDQAVDMIYAVLTARIDRLPINSMDELIAHQVAH